MHAVSHGFGRIQFADRSVCADCGICAGNGAGFVVRAALSGGAVLKTFHYFGRNRGACLSIERASSFTARTTTPHLSSPLRAGGTAWSELDNEPLISTQQPTPAFR